MFAELIHRLRPGAGFFTYIDEHTDGIMSESNTAVGRALPLWPYSASDNVNRRSIPSRTKMSFNLCMSFVDYSWRFVTVPQAEIRLRLHQNLAHGAPPALVVLGTMDQEDRQSLIAGKSIFRVAREAPGAVRRPAQRGPRAAVERGSADRLSRVFPAAERAAYPVCCFIEPEMAGRSRAEV